MKNIWLIVFFFGLVGLGVGPIRTGSPFMDTDDPDFWWVYGCQIVGLILFLMAYIRVFVYPKRRQ